ncbi:MAG: putative ABC transporter permease [Ruminiclostridium sp.]|nr:putative ABC transporter permease [Ruminiclostridium sp.]
MNIFAVYSLPQLLFLFYLFCNIGWVIESTVETLYRKSFINRGFLKGPYIPIYGFGGVTILVCCMPFNENGFLVYLVGVLSCTTLEYFVGWVMESIFQKQFWDYSMLKFTYKNRISLIPSLFWGLLSLFMVYILYDIVDAVVNFIPLNFVAIYDIVFSLIMAVDIFISVSSHIHFKEYLKKFPAEKAKKLLRNKYIRLGGEVIKRRQRRIVRMFERLRSEILDNDDDWFEEFPEMEDEREEKESAKE